MILFDNRLQRERALHVSYTNLGTQARWFAIQLGISIDQVQEKTIEAIKFAVVVIN